MAPSEKYPALMAYIADRSPNPKWCEVLREDEAAALGGGLGDVVADLQRAQQDYKEAEEANGRDGFPYNQAMGEFLGLAINPANHEPPHGYYMASCIAAQYRLGLAKRALRAKIDGGGTITVVTARSKATKKSVRVARFSGPEQIRIEGNAVVMTNGKRRATLQSNWSPESAMQRALHAITSGEPI